MPNNVPPRILFVPAQAGGHFNATLDFAHRLRERGYSVGYASEGTLTPKIHQQGFTPVSCPVNLFRFTEGFSVVGAASGKKFFSRMMDRLSGASVTQAKDNAAAFNRAINQFRPDLILLDAHMVHNYLILDKAHPPLLFVQTMLDNNRKTTAPPLNAAVPIGRTADHQKAWAVKRAEYDKRENSKLTATVSSIARAVVGKEEWTRRTTGWNHERSFHPLPAGIPELIMSPAAFDVPAARAAPEVIYTGSQRNLTRKAKAASPVVEELLARAALDSAKQRWVYCSLGTLSTVHNTGALGFLQKVVALFSRRPDWNLILSTGKEVYAQIDARAPNVHKFATVPQREVLARCDAFVTHGGLNSVLESIEAETPMVVFPLNDVWDQNGNAARVVHHGIGLRGRLERTTERELEEQLTRVLGTPSYREKCGALRAAFTAETGMEQALATVATALGNRAPSTPPPYVR